MEKNKLQRLEWVLNQTGLARSTLYEKMAAGTFPKPIKLRGRAVAWVEQEVYNWINDRIENNRVMYGQT